MNIVTIHESGSGADKLTVESHGNGTAYAIQFGEAGAPMRTLFLQGDDAGILRDEFEAMEEAFPEMLTRDIWIRVAGPYLG